MIVDCLFISLSFHFGCSGCFLEEFPLHRASLGQKKTCVSTPTPSLPTRSPRRRGPLARACAASAWRQTPRTSGRRAASAQCRCGLVKGARGLHQRDVGRMHPHSHIYANDRKTNQYIRVGGRTHRVAHLVEEEVPQRVHLGRVLLPPLGLRHAQERLAVVRQVGLAW